MRSMTDEVLTVFMIGTKLLARVNVDNICWH